MKKSASKTPKDDLTVNDLAGIVSRSFTEMQQQVQQFEQKVDHRFAASEVRFDELQKTLDQIEFFASGQGRRLEILEDRVRQLAVKAGLDFRRS